MRARGPKRALVRARLLLTICAVLAPALTLLPGRAGAVEVYEKDDFKLLLSGHIQNLMTSAEDPYKDVAIVPTVFGPMPEVESGHVTNNTARLRTTWRMLTGTPLSIEASVDTSYVFGSVLNSFSFDYQKDQEPPTYFNWEREFIDEDGRYGKFSVYRALLTWEAEKYRVIVGRQRLAYGTGLFWSPIDIWNPVSPLALEPSEKVGVDGVSGIWWINEKVSATALYGAGDDWEETRLAGSVSFRVESYTIDILAGKLFEDMVYGFDFVGYLGDAGVRGEFTYTVADKADDYPRAVIGLDYAWPNSLYIAGEYYHNGGPLELDMADPFAAFETYAEATGVDSRNRNFIALMATYDIDPVVVASMAVICDLDKGSEAFAPSMTWYASDHLSVMGGGQIFEGAKDGEYGSTPDLGWMKIRWDF